MFALHHAIDTSRILASAKHSMRLYQTFRGSDIVPFCDLNLNLPSNVDIQSIARIETYDGTMRRMEKTSVRSESSIPTSRSSLSSVSFRLRCLSLKLCRFGGETRCQDCASQGQISMLASSSNVFVCLESSRQNMSERSEAGFLKRSTGGDIVGLHRAPECTRAIGRSV